MTLESFPIAEYSYSVGFSDETWAANDAQGRQLATIHDKDTVEEWALMRRKHARWMFWGQFAGAVKGPAFV